MSKFKEVQSGLKEDMRAMQKACSGKAEDIQEIQEMLGLARKALTERQKDLEMKTQQLEVKLSNKTEEEIKKARRKSTQAGTVSGDDQCPEAHLRPSGVRQAL
ncbi:hypothetical protein Q9966_012290 [Columba livia]|nr:hypothetical protein Q9966_012290 [Columba livia]